MSEIESKRSAGVLDNAFITTASKSGGIDGLYRVGGSTFHVHVLMLLQLAFPLQMELDLLAFHTIQHQ